MVNTGGVVQFDAAGPISQYKVIATPSFAPICTGEVLYDAAELEKVPVQVDVALIAFIRGISAQPTVPVTTSPESWSVQPRRIVALPALHVPPEPTVETEKVAENT